VKNENKCYIYRNSYSSGKEWNLFYKVMKVMEDEFEYLDLLSFEKDCYGKITIIRSKERDSIIRLSKPCSNERFEKEYDKIKKDLEAEE